LCWFFRIGWLGFVLAISCHLTDGVREFHVQAIAKQLEKGVWPGEVSALLGDLKSRWIVVEVWDGLHREIRKLALLDDLRIYEVVNAVIKEFLKDREKVGFWLKG